MIVCTAELRPPERCKVGTTKSLAVLGSVPSGPQTLKGVVNIRIALDVSGQSGRFATLVAPIAPTNLKAGWFKAGGTHPPFSPPVLPNAPADLPPRR